MRRSVCLIAAAASIVWLASPPASAANADSPTIVPWHKIGDVAIGMLRGGVEYRYGTTETSGGDNYAYSSYKVPGGRLDVEYWHGRVFEVVTSSPRYATPTGLHVGSVIPLPPCKTVNGKCVRIWNGFRLNRQQSQAVWHRTSRYGGRKINVALSMGTFANGHWSHVDTVTSIAIWHPR